MKFLLLEVSFLTEQISPISLAFPCNALFDTLCEIVFEVTILLSGPELIADILGYFNIFSVVINLILIF